MTKCVEADEAIRHYKLMLALADLKAARWEARAARLAKIILECSDPAAIEKLDGERSPI